MRGGGEREVIGLVERDWTRVGVLGFLGFLNRFGDSLGLYGDLPATIREIRRKHGPI